MSFLLNCWYMVGWSNELDAQSKIARAVCGIPLLVFRSGDRICAMKDRCPHRFAPLSLGRLSDGVISCAYHGLAFDGSGACVHNPHGPVVNRMRVRSFPALERHKALWVWLGEAAADPAGIPDFSFLDEAPDSACSSGYLHGQGDYRLFLDNILDLSHLDFLHADSLGGGSIVGTRQKVSEDARTVAVRWSSRDVPASPLQIELGSFKPGALFDRSTEVRWFPAGAMSLTGRLGPQGASEDAMSMSLQAHVMTPETDRTTHYFFASTRNFRLDDRAYNDAYAASRDHIFITEDLPMVAAVQKRMGAKQLFDLDPLLMHIDAASVRVRRKLSAMIAAETSRAAEAARPPGDFAAAS